MNQAPQITPASTNFWLLKLVPAVRWGRWLTAIVIFWLILGPYMLVGDPAEEAIPDGVDPNVALFFATLFAYMIPVHHLIMQRSLNALAQLSPQLAEHPELISTTADQLLQKPRRWHLQTLSAGLVAGLIHNFLILGEQGLALTVSQPGSVLNLIITTALWVVMTATIASLMETAVLFRDLTGKVAIDVLNIRALTPFGAVAVSSTLALIGAQAAFPLLIVGSETSWVSFAPGLVATGAPMIVIFLLPVVPLHRRIAAAKQAALDRVANLLAPLQQSDQPDYATLLPLLTYRREVLAAPDWPFDTGVIGRLALYLIIPPLTWIGAALIEILVDATL